MFKKYGETAKLEVVPEQEVKVIEAHIAKTGKLIKDFSDEEREELYRDLDNSD